MYRLTKIFDWLKPKLERIGVGFNFSFKKTAILFAILIILSGALRWIRVIEVQLLERWIFRSIQRRIDDCAAVTAFSDTKYRPYRA